MIRVIPFILYLFLIALHQVIIKDATAIYSSTIDMAGMLVLLVALYKSELISLWFGFVAGVVLSAGHPGLLGWQAIVLGILGIVAYQVRERINLESLYAKLLLVLSGVFIHNVLTILISGGEGFFRLLLTSAFPGAVYTMVVSWVFFLIKEKRLTFQKIKSIF
jgi:rod shape-determining protein MreD